MQTASSANDLDVRSHASVHTRKCFVYMGAPACMLVKPPSTKDQLRLKPVGPFHCGGRREKIKKQREDGERDDGSNYHCCISKPLRPFGGLRLTERGRAMSFAIKAMGISPALGLHPRAVPQSFIHSDRRY